MKKIGRKLIAMTLCGQVLLSGGGMVARAAGEKRNSPTVYKQPAQHNPVSHPGDPRR